MEADILPFSKYHGVGNDFVFLDGITREEYSREDLRALAIKLCDRHFGIGSDGLIVACRPTTSNTYQADLRMRILNADGSEEEMCGNGLRCLVKFVVDRGLLS